MKGKNFFYIVLFFSLLRAENPFAQTRKVTISGLGGIATIPVKETVTDVGMPDQLFGGFGPGIYAELSGYYHFKSRIMLGIGLHYLASSKPNYAMMGNGSSLRLGYVFIPRPKHFWPYVFVGAGMANLKVTRDTYWQKASWDDPNLDANQIAISDVTYAYKSATFSEFVPSAEIGLGIDIVTYRRWSFALQTAFTYYLAGKNQFLEDNFPQGASNLPAVTATAGISYTLAYRDKPKNINSIAGVKKDNKSYQHHKQQGRIAAQKDAKLKEIAKTHIPHSNAFSPNQVAASKPGYLSEPQQVQNIEKQKLDPTKKYAVLGKVHGSTRPTEVIILTSKSNGKVKSVVAKNGFFAYTNLDPDDYEVKFESNNLKLMSEIKTVVDDGNMKISATDFKKFQYKKENGDPYGNMVQGRIKNMSTNQYANADHTVLLVNDKNEVVAKTIANKSGHFAFNRLKEDNYTALVETPDPNLSAELKAADDNPNLRLTGDQLKDFHFQALNRNEIDGAIVTGKLASTSNQVPVNDQSVLLVDTRGDVRQTQTDQKGNFAFKDLKHEDHQVVLENPNPAVTATVHPVADMTHMSVTAQDLQRNNYRILKADEPSNILTGKVEVSDQLKATDNLEILLLDEEGKVVASATTNKLGMFAFHELKADDYKAVVNSPHARINAHMHAPVNDPELIVSPQSLSSYNPVTKSYHKLAPDDKISLSGGIKEKGTLKPLEDQQVILLDQAGNIDEVSQTDKNGNFNFDNKSNAGYQVVFEGKKEHEYQSKMQIFKSPKEVSTIGKKVETIHYKVGSASIQEKDSSLVNRVSKHVHATMVKLRVYGSATEKDKAAQLNKARVQELKNKLISRGIPAKNIQVEDMGLPLQRQDAKTPDVEDARIEISIE